MNVEVVFALPDEQALIELELDNGATVADAIRAAGLRERFPSQNLDALSTGIWGRLAARDTVLSEGDRVELYRPLELDPRDARRLRAKDQDQVPDRDESRQPGRLRKSPKPNV